MNNNALQVFTYNNRQVRTAIINGEIWFVAKDVCKILGIKDHRSAVQALDDDEKRVWGISTPSNGGYSNINVISESGVYALVFKSRKPEAKQFSRWVRHEVLPSIRATGSYSVSTPPCVQSQIDALKADVARLTSENNALRNYIKEHHTFTILGEAIYLMSGCLSIGEGAKILAQHGLDIGQNRLFKCGRDKKLLGRRKGRQYNMPTQKAIEQGLFVINLPVGSKPAPMITTKGLQFFADLLAEKDFPILALACNQDALNA